MSVAPRFLISSAVFLVLLALGINWINSNRAMVEAEQRLLFDQIAIDQALAIERRLARSMVAATILAIEIDRHAEHFHDFEVLARGIIESLGGITNLQLAPGGVVRNIYPRLGHEAAIGHDLLNDPARRADALRTIANRELTLAGPFDLVQGGTGLIGRHPVFVERDGVEDFWGFTNVLILLDDLLAELDFARLEGDGYAYELSQLDPDSGRGEMIARSATPLSGPVYRAQIPVADREWELAISRSGTVPPALEIGGYLLAGTVSLLIATALYLILRQNQFLRRARDRADAANRERNAFLASMSHDIRTPLTGLLGVIHLLRRTGLDRDQQRYVETASTTGNMLLTVVNDLLDISRLDSDDFPLERSSVEIGELIEDVAGVVARTAVASGLDVVCDIDADLPYQISADPQRLRQVLNNLLGNVLARLRSGEIRVYAKPLDGAIEIGIVHPTISSDEDPTQPRNERDGVAGLRDPRHGMMISRRWIEAMGSRLEIEDEGGVTRYRFRLAIDPSEAEPYAWNPPEALRNISVCIMSPNAARRDSLARALRYWQIERVDEIAFDPERDPPPEASIPDLVLVDQVGGNEAVARFIENRRNSAEWRDCRFIQLLPQGANSDASVADLYLYKPVGQIKLYSALMEMLYRISLESEFNENASQDANAPQKPLQGRRLLLAEDNDINKVVALEILEETGAVIDVAVDGEEALEMTQLHDYDLILMDIQMPVMDGYEACRRIRALGGRHADIPIVAMTAHARDSDRGKSFDAGMNHHVAKPFDPDALIQVVIEQVRDKRRPHGTS